MRTEDLGPSVRRNHYAHGTYLDCCLQWGRYLRGRALCPDGRVRALARIARTADTYFSLRAAVKVRGRTVSGYVTITTASGSSVQTDTDREYVEFVPTGANADLFPPSAAKRAAIEHAYRYAQHVDSMPPAAREVTT